MRLPQVKPVAGPTRSPKGSFVAMPGTHSSGQLLPLRTVTFKPLRLATTSGNSVKP